MQDDLPDLPSHPSRTRRIGRAIAILGLCLSVLAGAAVLLVHTKPARQFVLSKITELVRRQNVDLAIEELDYNLLDMSVSVSRVRVQSHDALPRPVFAEIDRLRLDLALLPLVRGRYVLESAEAEGVRIHYAVAEDGGNNLPWPPRRTGDANPAPDYLIEKLHVGAVNVRYEDRSRHIDVVMAAPAVDVEGDAFTGRHTVRLAAGSAQVALGDRAIAIEALDGQVDAGDNDVRIERLHLAGEGSTLRLQGSLSNFDDPRLDVEARASVDVARVSTLTGMSEPVGGTVGIEGYVEGPLRGPSLRADIAGRDLSFRMLANIDLATRAAYDASRRTVSISGLRLRAPFGDVDGEGTVALDGDGESHLTASVTNLRSSPVMRAFGSPVILASRADARAEARWRGLEYSRASGAATAVLTPSTAGTDAGMPLGGRIAITGGGDVLAVVLSRVGHGSTLVDGRLRVVNRRRLDGRAQLRTDDVAGGVAMAEAGLERARGTLVPVHVAGPAGVEALIAGTVSSPRVAANIDAPSLRLGAARDLALSAAVVYTPAEVGVQRLEARWQGATAKASGVIGLQGAERINLALSAESLQVSELLRALERPEIPASGVLSAHGQVSGTASNPAATVMVNGADLVAYGEHWGTLTTRVDLEGRQVEVAALALDKPQPDGDAQVRGSGSYHLDRRTYTLSLQSDNLRLVGLTLPDGRAVRGDVQLTAQGEGSLERPAGTIGLAADGVLLDGQDLGQVKLDAVIADQQAAVDASAPMFGVTADARIGVVAPYPATAAVRIDGLQLQRLPLEPGTPVEGQLAATIDVAADLQAPRSVTATATLASFDGSWNGHPFRVETPSVIRYASEELEIDSLRVAAQDSTLEVSGNLPLSGQSGPGTIDVSARANLATLAQYAPASASVRAAGELVVMGAVRGTLQAIDPSLSLSISDASIAVAENEALSNLNVRARVEHGVATVEQLDASLASGAIMATAEIPLDAVPELPIAIPRPGGSATLQARVHGVELSQIPGAPKGLNGRLGLQAQLQAARADLQALEGNVTFDELQLAFNELTLSQPQPSTVTVADGQAHVDSFTLAGSVGTVSASGNVGLAGARPLDVDVNGDLNVAILSAFTDAVRAEGKTSLRISAGGTVAKPELDGEVNLADARFVVDEPTIAAEGVNASLDLSGRRVTLASLTGAINGGQLTGSGFVELGGGTITDATLDIAATEVANDFPLELRSLSNTNLRLFKQDDEFVLQGQVTIDEAGQTGDINFDEGLLAAISARRRLDLTERRNPFLERLRLDVGVDTASPILVDNNLARAEVRANIRVIGTPYEPALSGRLDILEDGQITLNERRYEVERGVITFIGEREILPSFDLRLTTSARDHDITVTVTGTPGETDTALVADPALPEPDIMALLVTGRTLDEMRGAEFEVAREQVLSYLAGRVGSQLGRGLEEATGLSSVRIEPNLIANETDPSARLTVGQELSKDLELVYSVDLTNSNDQIWIAEYDVTRRFQSNLVRESDASYRFEFRHDVRFGGRPAPNRMKRQRPRIAQVTIENDSELPDADIRRLLRVEAGDEFDFIAARAGADKVRQTLADHGRLESRVRLRRSGTGQQVDLTLEVTAGPRVELLFEGEMPPASIVQQARTQWQRGVFDAQRIDDVSEVLRGWLMQNDHLQARVRAMAEDMALDERRVRFILEPGPRFSSVTLTFPGASGVKPDVLEGIIKQQDLERQLFTDPIQVITLLKRYYDEQGFLVAELEEPRYEFEGQAARVVVTVDEGPRFIVRNVTAKGNTVLPAAALLNDLPVAPGEPFLPFAAERALQQIRDRYWGRGYNDVRANFQLALDRRTGYVDVAYTVNEGPSSVVADISVEGTRRTSEKLVREQVAVAPEQPLDLKALARSRANLYQTRAYSSVDVTREEGPVMDGQKPVHIDIAVREVQPFQLRYGASYDTERAFGGIVDVSNHNILGGARVVGLRSRLDSQVKEARGYFSQPSLRSWPIATTVDAYYRDEQNPPTATTGPFEILRRGVSVQQERKLKNAYVWSYGYRYEQARSSDPVPGEVAGELVAVSPLGSTLTRESRDEVLDATRGSFSSHAFQYSPSWLGSDQAYVKYFGQYFHYVPLRPPRQEPLTGEMLRPRLVFATGVRLGLSHAFGGEVPISERFFAGGSSTLRGFEQNAVGPVGLDRIPQGGQAMLVLNNELRFPLFRIFDGVAFVDVGNVFRRISDVSLTDLRKSGGIGLRVRTPWFLGRVDYGVPFDPRPGEPRGRLYFSIGQAF